MIGLPTTVSARMSVGSASTCTQRSAISSSTHDRAASVSRVSDPGFIITYDTRLIRSSPNRICGFIAPATASTFPLARSHSWPATVVDPTSNATPSARSRKPGHTATIVVPSCTATVAVQSPARSVRCNTASTWSSQSRPVSDQSRSNASNSRSRSPDGSAMSGSRTST